MGFRRSAVWAGAAAAVLGGGALVYTVNTEPDAECLACPALHSDKPCWKACCFLRRKTKGTSASAARAARVAQPLVELPLPLQNPMAELPQSPTPTVAARPVAPAAECQLPAPPKPLVLTPSSLALADCDRPELRPELRTEAKRGSKADLHKEPRNEVANKPLAKSRLNAWIAEGRSANMAQRGFYDDDRIGQLEVQLNRQLTKAMDVPNLKGKLAWVRRPDGELWATLELDHDASGQVTRARLVGSSGDDDYDTRLLAEITKEPPRLSQLADGGMGLGAEGMRTVWRVGGHVVFDHDVNAFDGKRDKSPVESAGAANMLRLPFDEATGNIGSIDIHRPHFECQAKLIELN